VLEAIDEYLEGHEENLLQVRTLFPGLDLEPYKSYMRVEGGRLINPTEGTWAGTSKKIPKMSRAGEGATDDAEPLVKLS